MGGEGNEEKRNRERLKVAKGNGRPRVEQRVQNR